MSIAPFRPALVIVGALTLAACGSEPADEQGADAPVIAGSTGAEAQEPQAAQSPDTRIASNYSRLDLDRCTLIEQLVEGESASWKCTGLGGAPLFVNSGDGRFDIDAGADDGRFDTIPGFNETGDTIEWRMTDGRPFAIVYRLRDISPEGDGSSTLFVKSVGTQEAPGCLIAQVPGSAREANVLAREQADRAVHGFDCPAPPVTQTDGGEQP